MDGVELETGVKVPAGSRASWDSSNLFCGGALFADDAVGLVDTLEGCRLFCDRITQWCAANEMSVGIRKCGILEFPPANADPILTEEHPERPTLLLSGQAVPIVSTYKYLGLHLTAALDRSSLVAGRLAKARATAYAVSPFLRCSTVPPPLRLATVRAVVIPRCLYGAEVFGMNRSLTTEVQRLVNHTLRSVLGIFGGKHWVPSAGLWAELRIPPVCAVTAARRARAYQKCFQLKTTIGTIIRHPLRSRYWTWSSGIPKWIHRFCVPHMADESMADSWQELDPRALAELVQSSIEQREYHIRQKPHHRHAEATRWYFGVGAFHDAPLAIGRVGIHPRDVQGIALVIRARIGALRLAPELVEANILSAEYAAKCPFCNLPEPETLSHLFFRCPKWARPRAGVLGPVSEAADKLSQQPASQSLSCPMDEAKLSWILGGVQGKLRVRSWSAPKPSKSLVDQAEAPGPDGNAPGSDDDSSVSSDASSSSSSGSESLDTSRGSHSSHEGGGTQRPSPCVLVARFLQIVMRKRARTISALSSSTVGSLDITPATATGQRPDG